MTRLKRVLGRGLKEPFCGLSHLVGALLSVVGLVVLLVEARGRPTQVVAFSIYGLSLIALYSASAVYHSLHVGAKQTARLQRFDYISIFLLIAGTYTPVCLLTLRGALGWWMLAAEYAMGAVGITMIVFWHSAPHWLRVPLYIAMGWLALIALPQLRAALPPGALSWLLAGGLAYTGGTVIYATDRPHLWPGRFSAHDLWHLFVLGGSICHYVLILGYVAPSAG